MRFGAAADADTSGKASPRHATWTTSTVTAWTTWSSTSGPMRRATTVPAMLPSRGCTHSAMTSLSDRTGPEPKKPGLLVQGHRERPARYGSPQGQPGTRSGHKGLEPRRQTNSTPLRHPTEPANWATSSRDSTPDGKNGWGNEESGYYTNDPDNAQTDGDGNLAITPTRRDGSRSVTTAPAGSDQSPITQNKAEFAYGRIETRLQVPDGGDWSVAEPSGASAPTPRTIDGQASASRSHHGRRQPGPQRDLRHDPRAWLRRRRQLRRHLRLARGRGRRPLPTAAGGAGPNESRGTSTTSSTIRPTRLTSLRMSGYSRSDSSCC